jgi:hypothetical protein
MLEQCQDHQADRDRDDAGEVSTTSDDEEEGPLLVKFWDTIFQGPGTEIAISSACDSGQNLTCLFSPSLGSSPKQQNFRPAWSVSWVRIGTNAKILEKTDMGMFFISWLATPPISAQRSTIFNFVFPSTHPLFLHDRKITLVNSTIQHFLFETSPAIVAFDQGNNQ